MLNKFLSVRAGGSRRTPTGNLNSPCSSLGSRKFVPHFPIPPNPHYSEGWGSYTRQNSFPSIYTENALRAPSAPPSSANFPGWRFHNHPDLNPESAAAELPQMGNTVQALERSLHKSREEYDSSLRQ